MQQAQQDEALTDLLLEGARYGDMEDVEQALEQGAQLDWRDEQGRTALHMASANGHEETVSYLVKAGADSSVANSEGNTPLHFACLNGHVQVVQHLMQYGANPSALNSHSRSPVDEALGRPHQDAIFQALDKALATGSKHLPEDVQMEEDGQADEHAPDKQQALASQGSDDIVIPNKYGPGS